ncbi:hypothetical protein PoB_005759300 [Plakobranchus ocellatus]|uniref:Uncharacterized protein n=1 Tax=Plakobranchus ocellatus TaxID=259542 RepID=A0AAV4CGK8_9GAST|nr:hypothetical protein PoB_005759300 [Plakobranchus ocellatus]
MPKIIIIKNEYDEEAVAEVENKDDDDDECDDDIALLFYKTMSGAFVFNMRLRNGKLKFNPPPRDGQPEAGCYVPLMVRTC